MREINLNRQKLGLEDLLFGVGIVTQIRAGQNVDVTKINAGNLPFDETQSLLEWAQSINLEALSSMTTQLQTIYDNLTTIGNVEDNLTVINTLEDNVVALQSLHTNIAKLQNIDTNMSKLQNIDTNMSKLQAIYTDLTKLESIYDNLTMLLSIYNSLTALNNINSQVIPNLTELLLVNDNAIQVAADKLTVATDKGIVSGYKDDVSAMKVAVETIYDTFDDSFLGVKTNDPTVDNDGNALQDGAMYFNGSSNALKVYSLDNTTWYTIPQLYLSGLLDVTLTSITTGDILTWNGTNWVNTRTPSFDSVKLNGGTSTAGTATWNNTEYTYDIVLNPNVTLQVGQEDLVYCKNNTASVITNGRPVMAVGTNGNSGNILVDLHDGTKANARRIVGIATEDLTANGYGFVTRNGKVRGLNTTGSQYGETWVDGDILYVKATGNLTNVEPADTALKMPIAFVIHAHTNGTLYVRTTGIDENHDRDLIANKIDKAVVEYSNANDVAGYPHFIRFTQSTTNTPVPGNYYEGYTTTGTGYQVMTISLVSGGGPNQTPQTWTRANRASGWTPWVEVLTTANGKAVDSDKLDGINSSQFIRSDIATTVVDGPLLYGQGAREILRTNNSSGTLSLGYGYSNVLIQNNKAWHAGNDGYGSGLDADKLDGIDGALYLQSKNLGSSSVINTIGSGIYRYEGSPDSPTGSYGTLLSVRGSNGSTELADALGQIAFNYAFPNSTIAGNSKNHYIRGAVAVIDAGNPDSVNNTPFDLLYTNKNLGYLLGFTFLSRYASPSHLNGSLDVTTVLQNALNNNKVVYIDIGTTPYLNGAIQMPQGTRLSCLAPATLRGNTQLRIGPSGVINPSAYCVIENLGISKMASQYVFNEVAGLSSGGVAIQTTYSNVPAQIVNVQILNNIITGFNMGIDTLNGGDTENNTRGRWIIRGNKFDNNIDIRAGYCLDTMYVSQNHSYPFLGSAIINGTWKVVNSGGIFRSSFIYGANQYNDWFLVTDCFSHSNRVMIEGYFNGKITGGGYDCEDYSSSGHFDTAQNIGLYLTTTGSTRGITTINGMSFNGGQLHCKFVFANDNNGISMINMVGCHHERFVQAAVGIKDHNGIAGGGIVNISGATTSPGSNGGIPDYIWIQTGYSKLNVTGWLRMGSNTLQYKEATATYQSTGELTL